VRANFFRIPSESLLGQTYNHEGFQKFRTAGTCKFGIPFLWNCCVIQSALLAQRSFIERSTSLNGYNIFLHPHLHVSALPNQQITLLYVGWCSRGFSCVGWLSTISPRSTANHPRHAITMTYRSLWYSFVV